MKITRENLQLSGKGARVTNELLHDNIKLIADDVLFYEVIVEESDETEETAEGMRASRRLGWLVPGSLEILADFTTHSDVGMQGKSTDDHVERSLLLDGSSLLQEFIPQQLEDVDTTEAQELLDRMVEDHGQFTGKINIDNVDQDDGLLVLSPHSKFVFVQTEDTSVRIHAHDGIYVLNRGDGRDNLVIIDHDDGINVRGEKNVSITREGLIINGQPFDLGGIVGNALSSIGPAMASLSSLQNLGNISMNFESLEEMGERLGEMGERIGRAFERNFEKNFETKFEKKFGKNFKKGFTKGFDDDDDSEFFDVDIDY